MKVYLVSSGSYSDYSILSIHKSWRKALLKVREDWHRQYERICNPDPNLIATWQEHARRDKYRAHDYKKSIDYTLDTAKEAKALGYFAWRRKARRWGNEVAVESFELED